MRIAMTLLVRDEADVVDAWLRYHLARGVDLVLAMDHRSRDGTSEILAEHARDGRVVVVREESETVRQSEWMTRLSRLAATEHAADWVIPSDADEFWWPRYETLAETLAAVPERFGVVRGIMRPFVLVAEDETNDPFERLTLRARPAADLTSQYHAQVKVAHRARSDVRVSVGNHDADAPGLRLLREWFPFEVLHFPLRTRAQLEDKFRRRPTTGQHTERAVALLAAGDLTTLLAEATLGAKAAEARLRDGDLVRDERLRDALRALRETGSLPPATPPTLADDADLAEDVQVVLEHDAAVRLERRCTRLEQAVALTEARRSLSRVVARRIRSLG